ncbi:SGNH/GDSL hydrolase family protein [Lachnoclostridium sp. Marseille-P6806]|uniref:SGNH/GDSL hydrolase family protein n=1 Tax=Lachnoclostridium sp. Marseille-P6806 TaxID=2364793 RepID=UPI0013EEFA49|nr:SGNH/GDSL hydrolase family protein [Lachnoclostridium sp. Marseille-P6806]
MNKKTKQNIMLSCIAALALCAALLAGYALGSSKKDAGSASEPPKNTEASAGTTAAEEETDKETPSAEQTAEAEGENADTAKTEVIVADEHDLIEPEVEPTENKESERPSFDGYVTNKNGQQLQVVFLGDSQLDNFRDDTGIAYLVMHYLQADVYNLSMGGTTFSLDKVDNTSDENWNARCGLGIARAVAGKVNDSFFDGFEAHRQFSECDFSKTDVFVIEYGVNDFLAKHPHVGAYNADPYSYTGAITNAVTVLKDTYPNAKILICTPTYAVFNKSNNRSLQGDSNMVSNGYATLADYAGAVESLTQKLGVDCFDAYDVSGITNANYDEYLLDGIHMNAAGRRMYAQAVCRIILREMGYSVEEGKNLDELDFSTLTRN